VKSEKMPMKNRMRPLNVCLLQRSSDSHLRNLLASQGFFSIISFIC
jgi:hypothetical protein